MYVIMVVVLRPDLSKVGGNMSQRDPFFDSLLQTGRLKQQTECIAVLKKHVGRSVVYFGLSYFRKFSYNFCAIVCRRIVNLHLPVCCKIYMF